MRAFVLILAVSATGCFALTDGGECFVDGDCGGDLQCSRTNECESAANLRTIRLTWTVNGAAPTLMTPTPCDGISELEVTFRDPTSGEDVAFRPVTCALGLATYDKLALRFDRVVLAAYDADGRVLDIVSRALIGDEPDVAIDLTP